MIMLQNKNVNTRSLNTENNYVVENRSSYNGFQYVKDLRWHPHSFRYILCEFVVLLVCTMFPFKLIVMLLHVCWRVREVRMSFVKRQDSSKPLICRLPIFSPPKFTPWNSLSLFDPERRCSSPTTVPGLIFSWMVTWPVVRVISLAMGSLLAFLALACAVISSISCGSSIASEASTATGSLSSSPASGPCGSGCGSRWRSAPIRDVWCTRKATDSRRTARCRWRRAWWKWRTTWRFPASASWRLERWVE